MKIRHVLYRATAEVTLENIFGIAERQVTLHLTKREMSTLANYLEAVIQELDTKEKDMALDDLFEQERQELEEDHESFPAEDADCQGCKYYGEEFADYCINCCGTYNKLHGW